MNNYSYQSNKFEKLLTKLQTEQANGLLVINSQVDSDRIIPSVLVWKNGGIVYGNWKITDGQEIAKKLLQKLNPKMAEAALKFVKPKVNSSSSIRQLLSLLTKVRALTWQQIEAYIQTQVASIIEQNHLYSGIAHLEATQNFDLSFGEDEHSLNWSNLNKEMQERQKKWRTFIPETSHINAIPEAQTDKLASISQTSIRDHIQKWIDGKHSLIEIAAKLDKDPLNVARSYYNWVESGWITFKNYSQSETFNSTKDTSTQSDNLSTVLSVDDSLIVQTSIKRALEGNYHIILSDNATDALNILNQNKVDLLLLDVTMPNINGLDMCRTLRKIPKFKHLPIVMVTARNRFSDKMRGQIAGTNHYLTKPFNKAKLLEVINQLIGTKNTSQIGV